MATPVTLPGILARLYYNSATWATPTWVHVALVGDLNIPQKWDMAEILVRATRMKLKAKTGADVGITGKLLSSKDATANLAIIAAMMNDDVIDFMALNAAHTVNGARGWRFEAQVFAANQDQGAGNVIWDEFDLQPALTANMPTSVLVASGAPVFTAI